MTTIISDGSLKLYEMALVVPCNNHFMLCGYKNTLVLRIAADPARAHVASVVIITSHNSLTLRQKGETILIPTAVFFYSRILISKTHS